MTPGWVRCDRGAWVGHLWDLWQLILVLVFRHCLIQLIAWEPATERALSVQLARPRLGYLLLDRLVRDCGFRSCAPLRLWMCAHGTPVSVET